MTKLVRFYIDVHPDQVPYIRLELSDASIHNFSEVRNMLHIPHNNMQHGIFTGNEGEFAIREMNRYFERTGLTIRLPEGFTYMGTEARAQLLELATDHARWSTGYGPTALWVDPDAAKAFRDNHPAPVVPEPAPSRPPYRQLRFPPLPAPWRPERPPCPVPGCDHKPGYGKKAKYCWGHSVPNQTWDGLNWTTFDKALHGTECRYGKDGGIFNCDQGMVPAHLSARYRAERKALEDGVIPVPGP